MNILKTFNVTGLLAMAFVQGSAARLAAQPANSGAESPLALPLDSIAQRVRSHNPHLRAAALRIEEARARLDQAGRLRNPELAAEYRRTSGTGEHSFEAALSQAFPLTARLRLEKAVSRAALAIAEAEVREVERQLIAKARDAAVRYAATQHQIALRREQETVARELAAFAVGIAGRGEGSAIDAGQARLESTQISLEIRQLESAAASVLGELKPLLGLAPAARLAISGGLPAPGLPRGSSIDLALRPDYRAAVMAVDGAQDEIALEKARRLEDISAGIVGESTREEDAPRGLENDSVIGFRVSIPLPLWNRNRGAIREKEAKKLRAEEEARALSIEIQNEAAAALDEMRVHAGLLREIDGDLLPLAERQVNLSDVAYRSGQADLQAVLRARDRKIKLASGRLEALRDFHLARVRFEAAAGLTDVEK